MDMPLRLVELVIGFARDGRLSADTDDLLASARAIADSQVLRPVLAETALAFSEAGRRDDARELLAELERTDGYSGLWVVPAALAWAQLQRRRLSRASVRHMGHAMVEIGPGPRRR